MKRLIARPAVVSGILLAFVQLVLNPASVVSALTAKLATSSGQNVLFAKPNNGYGPTARQSLSKPYSINYHDGERFPHLERDPSRPDLLQQIIKPLQARS